MTRKKRTLSAEEEELWVRVTANATAKARSRAPIAAKHLAPTPARPGSVQIPIVRGGPRPANQSPPAERSADRRVRRGALEVDATLDLHGHTQVTAAAALARFLQLAAARGARVVVVVTGAGRAGEGVLKRRLPGWLEQADTRPIISGYAPAHRKHGGAGAFYVFLKRAGR